jgi:hypothetical protein
MNLIERLRKALSGLGLMGIFQPELTIWCSYL